MSVTISRSAIFCPSVSLNGRTLARRFADAIVDDDRDPRLAIGRVPALAQHEAGLEQKELLEDQPLLGEVRYALSASMSVPFDGKCDSTVAMTPIRQAAFLTNRRRDRIRQLVRKQADEVMHERPLHPRRHRAGLLVNRNDATRVHRRVVVLGVAADDLVLRIRELQSGTAILHRSEEDDVLLRMKHVVEECLVGKDGAHGSRLVAHDQLEQPESGPACRAKS